MELDFDKKTGQLKIDLDENDINDAYHVQQMMLTPGWNVLVKYLAAGRESLIDALKNAVRTRVKRELCPELAATLKGYDEFIAIPSRIVERAQSYIKDNSEKKEEENNDGHKFNGE